MIILSTHLSTSLTSSLTKGGEPPLPPLDRGVNGENSLHRGKREGAFTEGGTERGIILFPIDRGVILGGAIDRGGRRDSLSHLDRGGEEEALTWGTEKRVSLLPLDMGRIGYFYREAEIEIYMGLISAGSFTWGWIS